MARYKDHHYNSMKEILHAITIRFLAYTGFTMMAIVAIYSFACLIFIFIYSQIYDPTYKEITHMMVESQLEMSLASRPK